MKPELSKYMNFYMLTIKAGICYTEQSKYYTLDIS